MWQPAGSEPIDRNSLVVPLARSFVEHLILACGEFARFVECRKLTNAGLEIVSFDIEISVPQRPVYEIISVERVSACFWESQDAAPAVAVGRSDFPDTPHQNLAPEGFPSFLCVDDRPWQDVRSTYTASELMARIQIWFAKACEGELHGDEQSFDPIFQYDGFHELIVTEEASTAMGTGGKLSVWAGDERARVLVVTDGQKRPDIKNQRNVHILYLSVAARAMKRMRRAPRTLGDLARLLDDRGVDLVNALEGTTREWLNHGRVDQDDRWITCVLVSMPQVHPRTGVVGGERPMGFLCNEGPGRIGEALGVLGRAPSMDRNSIRYTSIIAPTVDPKGLEDFPIQIAPVHRELDAMLASDIAGRQLDQREVVLIGAGSLGSHLAENLAREGLFRWTVVDDDTFLPHNVAKHTLTKLDLGQPKARILATQLELIRSDTTARAICESVLRQKLSTELIDALNSANIIIDASASVPVSKWLADQPSKARRICCFFTPDGKSAVLIVEPATRAITLRELEVAYLRELLTNPLMADHLGSATQFRYSGACRALSNRIPASSVAVLAGILSAATAVASTNNNALVHIWRIGDDGGIGRIDVPAAVKRSFVGDWTIALPATLIDDLRIRRGDALPAETGGSLVGIIDYAAKYVGVVHALSTPPDSIGTRAGFVRGTRGLQRLIEAAQARSGGQVRYIGEWHSHPPGASAAPSQTDIEQIQQLSLILKLDGLPALSLIVSESGVGMLLGKAA
jgi:integrative and conjugative element protein (TIGR02256 family)